MMKVEPRVKRIMEAGMQGNDGEELVIGDGLAELALLPGMGGAVARFCWRVGEQRIDWLRPTNAAAVAAGDTGETAAFPLVPYSNRIRGGRFRFDGTDVQLPVTPADPHFEHGHGWRARWEVIEAEPAQAMLCYRHAADAWPWSYEARQGFALEAGILRIDLALTNLSPRPMPAGLGLHPYFPIDGRTEITAGVEAIWQTDAEVLPTRLEPPAPGADPGRGLKVAEVQLDNVFAGWDRMARIAWPEQGRSLEMRASAPLDFLVLYTPAGETFFAAEPVSNATDAVNLAAQGRRDTGLTALAPGATLMAQVELRPVLGSQTVSR